MGKLGQQEDLVLYEPPQSILEALPKVRLRALVGPSGSGKSTIIDILQKKWPTKYAQVVGDTTRRPRKGEVDGATYNFRAEEEMIHDLHARRFLQVVPGSMGNFYATRPEQYPANKFAIMAIQARVMEKFQKLRFKDIKWLLIVPCSDKDWLRWQESNAQSVQDRKEREAEAIDSYARSLSNPNTYYILNDTPENAARRIVQVDSNRRPDNEILAKQTAICNLEALKARLALTHRDNE
ncbi:hypothetical protein H0X09_00560 [Candidatus Saccharibacteria bacterium]|nr:hypothetical protein [Candidatus Saccharibacteria bacterium]